ncbi:ABC transporter ATP-binding protein [Streptomyces gardneri]|uniref:ATP-binding cassette domain-containing protein n=1 Tax=Nocardia TaxID=1817 RepID=UPI0013573F84|nr:MULTISPECIES: ABC transporter ATP-binding protein [Nocardia]MBF6167491.1 ABC transporter ATP-binding protein [Streptomyces gardneri]
MGLGITCSGLRREFAGVAVVDDVTFQAPAGRVTAVVGPNGAGKTTLLLMLAGQLRPHKGYIRVGQTDPAVEPWVVRSQVGWVPDVYESSETWSIAEVLHYSASIAGHNGSRSAELVERALDLARLRKYSAEPVLHLSRSTKKWLSLARALVSDPAVLVLDNPMADLDDEGRGYLSELLRDFARQNMTIVVSALATDGLAGCAQESVHLDHGRVVGSRGL